MNLKRKSVLIIAGSPRKGGNSDLLCDEFMYGAIGAGNAAEKIYLQEKTVGGCLACYGCRETRKCVQKDDMAEILKKIMRADVIVLATPVYFYAMSGQMNTMIDRTLPCYREIIDKEFYFIVTAADKKASMERAMDGLYGFTDCLPGAKIMGTIYGEGVYEKGEITSTRAMKDAYEMGKRVAGAVEEERVHEQLYF